MKEMSSSMKERQGQQQQQKQIEWRRSKVMELSSQGYSQVEISKTLQISEPTISRDIDYLRQQSKQKIRKYIDETLPEEYEKCLVGITSILKEAWNTSQNTETNKREKIQALSLAKECYSMKLDLLTNATVVDDAIRFVSGYNNNNKRLLLLKTEEDTNKQQTIEERPDYNDNESDLEEETKEIMKEPTTTNQVF
jgi:predicted transcriptional regulator